MTRKEIKTEIERCFKAGEITLTQYGEFLAIWAKQDAEAAKPIPVEVSSQFNVAAKRLDYLASRWSDESEYEDWAEYDKAARNLFPAPFKVLKVTQRPFKVQFTHPSDTRPFTISVGRKITLAC